jgi:predicted DsbA family dithiol-disulfide isomerase
MTARVAELAKAEGLDFDSSSLAVNTLEAHRVLHLAADLGFGDAAKERLLRAHFTEGANLSDHETLTRLVVEAGPPGQAGTIEARAREVLASREYENAVLDDLSLARRMGISGVPFFAIDRKYAISGAQSPETFLHALRTAYADENAPAS